MHHSQPDLSPIDVPDQIWNEIFTAGDYLATSDDPGKRALSTTYLEAYHWIKSHQEQFRILHSTCLTFRYDSRGFTITCLNNETTLQSLAEAISFPPPPQSLIHTGPMLHSITPLLPIKITFQ